MHYHHFRPNRLATLAYCCPKTFHTCYPPADFVANDSTTHHFGIFSCCLLGCCYGTLKLQTAQEEVPYSGVVVVSAQVEVPFLVDAAVVEEVVLAVQEEAAGAAPDAEFDQHMPGHTAPATLYRPSHALEAIHGPVASIPEALSAYSSGQVAKVALLVMVTMAVSEVVAAAATESVAVAVAYTVVVAGIVVIVVAGHGAAENAAVVLGPPIPLEDHH